MPNHAEYSTSPISDSPSGAVKILIPDSRRESGAQTLFENLCSVLLHKMMHHQLRCVQGQLEYCTEFRTTLLYASAQLVVWDIHQYQVVSAQNSHTFAEDLDAAQHLW